MGSLSPEKERNDLDDSRSNIRNTISIYRELLAYHTSFCKPRIRLGTNVPITNCQTEAEGFHNSYMDLWGCHRLSTSQYPLECRVGYLLLLAAPAAQCNIVRLPGDRGIDVCRSKSGHKVFPTPQKEDLRNKGT